MITIKGGNINSGVGATTRNARRGEESDFPPEDYMAFDQKLAAETALAASWQLNGKYMHVAPQTPSLGCEVESFLAGPGGLPAPLSAKFMEYFSNDNGYYEMAKFNMEFEIAPVPFSGRPFSEIHCALENNRVHSSRCADMIDAKVLLCGILPTLKHGHFTPDMITDRKHFRALERQLRRLNKDRPFHVKIGGGEGLEFQADNLSVEGAAASLQVHLGVDEPLSAAYYNASQLVSALTVGAAANSPFFMGKQLWDETRVPLFEQIMYERFVGRNAEHLSHGRRCDNVFGHGYLAESAVELFRQNFTDMAAVLPIPRDSPPHEMKHLILHNRDILRWNRPVLGFMNGAPFLRIEHRAMPSGPTAADMAANMAFYAGLAHHFHKAFVGKTAATTAERMPFSAARDNFYRAARDGFNAEINWLGKECRLRDLILEKALSYAKRGLLMSGVEEDEADGWLGIIRARAESGQNGSTWQRRYVGKNGGGDSGLQNMAEAYWQNQEEGAPVHTWKV